MSGEQQQPGEATPALVYQAVPCKYCSGPVVAPKRKGLVKEFCCDRHRAAWRDEQLVKSVQRVQAALDEFTDELQTAAASLERMAAVGVQMKLLLDRLLPKRIKDAAQSVTQSAAKDEKGIDKESSGP